MVTFINSEQYYGFCEQAAKNDGRIIIDAPGFSRTEIRMNVEYAKEVWAEIERITAMNGLELKEEYR